MKVRERFAPIVLYLLGALLAWMGCFVGVYVLAALACARGFAAFALGGLPVVKLFSVVLVLAAATLSAWIVRRAHAALGREKAGDGAARDARAFVPFVALGGGVLVLIALLWLALPPLLLSAQC
jgi:hypothetical protein